MPEPHLPDLYVHTHLSDHGEDSPQDLISMSAHMGVDLIAFTDLESVAGTPMTSTQGVRVLRDVEMSSAFRGSESRLLASGIDAENPTLEEILETNDRDHCRQFQQRLDARVSLDFRKDADVARETAARRPEAEGILTMFHRLNPSHENLRSYGTSDQPEERLLSLRLLPGRHRTFFPRGYPTRGDRPAGQGNGGRPRAGTTPGKRRRSASWPEISTWTWPRVVTTMAHLQTRVQTRRPPLNTRHGAPGSLRDPVGRVAWIDRASNRY